MGQIAGVLAVAGLAYVLCLNFMPPGPAAGAVGVVALIAIVMILIKPFTMESWENFWDGMFGWMRWW